MVLKKKIILEMVPSSQLLDVAGSKVRELRLNSFGTIKGKVNCTAKSLKTFKDMIHGRK